MFLPKTDLHRIKYSVTHFLIFLYIFLAHLNAVCAQELDNPNWNQNGLSCVQNALLYPGVALVTCGVTEPMAINERYSMAFVSLNEGRTITGREEITHPDSVLHHSDWLVQNIGNVFGIAIKQQTAEAFVTASSNYGSGFGYAPNVASILNYGSIGGVNEVEAAGRIYRIDPLTGAATVFSTLPQQAATLEHWDCEQDNQEITRNNTGVGLGNIAYDELNDQFFVTNAEDGRIYRVSSSGLVLDSYDFFETASTSYGAGY